MYSSPPLTRLLQVIKLVSYIATDGFRNVFLEDLCECGQVVFTLLDARLQMIMLAMMSVAAISFGVLALAHFLGVINVVQ